VLGGLLLFGATWLVVGLLFWVVQLVAGRYGWLPWVPLTVLALAVPLAQAHAALLLLRPGTVAAPREGGAAVGRGQTRVGTALGLAAGLGAAVMPLALTASSLGALQPALAQVPTVLTVLGGAAAVVLLGARHGLRPDRLAPPPASLAVSATALALVWLGLALDQGSGALLVPALPGVLVVVLSALTGARGYRGGLVLGWWWGLVATGGSLLVTGLVLGITYGQAWAGLVIVGVAVALVAAWLAVRAAPAGA
jgi:hypothetical protein